MRRALPVIAASLFVPMVTTLSVGATVNAAEPEVVAFDMVGSSSQNLIAHLNPYAGAFASPGDGFEKYRRGVSASIPFSVLDDSLSVFPTDNLGIIGEGNADEFFGVTDTVNPENSLPVSASWVFDVTDVADLSLSVDLGAMGDFELDDVFTIAASIDGGPADTLLTTATDEAGSQIYTMAGGAVIALDDPLTIAGAPLANSLTEFTADIAGTGAELTITLTASTDGASEAFAMQNLRILSGADTGAEPGDVVITEIMQNPAFVSDSTGEWFEVANVSDVDVDLAGWTVRDDGSDSFVVASSVIVPAGGRAVLGINADTTANGGVDVDYRYSGMFLANGDDEIVLLDPDLVEIDRVDYDGGPGFPDPNGASMNLDPDSTDAVSNDDGSNWCEATEPYGVGDSGTPGATNTSCGDSSPIGVCGGPATYLHEVQGTRSASPLVGQTVVVEAVVVGDFQDRVGTDGDLNGFHVQEEDDDTDADPTTSEGLFVFQGSNPVVDVAKGDLVRVLGAVSEFNGLTEITASEVLVCGPVSLPTPSTVHLPIDSFDSFEAVEGMSVVSDQDLTISEYFNFDRFGEIVLTSGRLFQPTAVFAPGSADAAALADLNSRSRLTLDDGRTSQNPDPARHPNGAPFTLDNRFRGGDVLSGVAGVMDYSFGLYRIQPTAGAVHTVTNPRPDVPTVGGELTVASFNVLNYFNTLDDGPDVCGPAQNQECRGADDETERVRQLDKIVAAMSEMDADVLGIIEVENTAGVEAMADIVDGLNDTVGAGTYAYVDTGTVGDDAIKVGFIYQPGSVTPVGDFAVLDDPAFVAPFGAPRNRAALAQTFTENLTGSSFTAVVNHFKSKGSGCGVGDDDPEAGNCNLTRTVSAEVLATWLETDPTGSGDADVMILGDLNAYDQEDPITALAAAGYTDLEGLFGGEFAYSYVFDGQLGYLDYVLANGPLLPQVTGAAAWHINADEPDLLDYDTSFKRPAQAVIYAPDPFRASDHDPVLSGLHLGTDAATVISLTIERVDALEHAGALNRGQANALRRRLAQALRQYDLGRIESSIAILNGVVEQLGDFVADGVLTAEQAAPLTGALERLLDDIG